MSPCPRTACLHAKQLSVRGIIPRHEGPFWSVLFNWVQYQASFQMKFLMSSLTFNILSRKCSDERKFGIESLQYLYSTSNRYKLNAHHFLAVAQISNPHNFKLSPRLPSGKLTTRLCCASRRLWNCATAIFDRMTHLWCCILSGIPRELSIRVMLPTAACKPRGNYWINPIEITWKCWRKFLALNSHTK